MLKIYRMMKGIKTFVSVNPRNSLAWSWTKGLEKICKEMNVEVLDFLRDEKKFHSFKELKDQILKDVKKAKLFHENK